MAIEIPKEVWDDPARLFKVFKQINERLIELLKLEKQKAKRRKELEREAKKSNKRRVLYGTREFDI